MSGIPAFTAPHVIPLGAKVKDTISGFEGVVTGRAQYISGCAQSLVAPTVTSEGAFRDGQWFDTQRLRIVDDSMVILNNGPTPGPDRQAPKR